MKKLLSSFLILVLCLSLTACGGDTEENTDPTPNAVGLYVDGVLIGATKSETEIEAVLNTLQSKAITLVNGDDLQVSFVQDVEVKEGVYADKEVVEAAELLQRLQTAETSTYTVQTGDTFTQIAYKHNLTEEELKNLNPTVDINNLQIGQELVVWREQYILQVKVIQTVQEEVEVPYETIIVYREDKYVDWTTTTTKGVDGLKTVTTAVAYMDGRETERIVVEEVVTQEPIAKVVEIGTMKHPSSGDGSTTEGWVWPVPICHRVYVGYSSSHKAIDISSGPEPVLGKPAVAANGGEVIFASTGWNDGYGTTVKIQHDNGLVTVYAHLQSVSVEVGQKVSAGQEIGLIGNTGNSPGPHLHFEVIKNGVMVNPLDYVTP